MFGGKFLPFHQGHRHCLTYASRECDIVYCIMFVNSADEVELEIPSKIDRARLRLFRESVSYYPNVVPIVLNVAKCRLHDGSDDWGAEASLVKKAIGERIDAVYSSEPSYDSFFKGAYPGAVHRVIDPQRKMVPISGTKIREMCKSGDERWRMFL